MKDHQTPRKDVLHRRSNNSNKTPKMPKKSLNSEFTHVSDDLLTDSFNFSPISEVLSVDNHNTESIQRSQWLTPADKSSIPGVMEALTSSDSGSSSKITTVNDEGSDSSVEGSGKVEIEMVSNLLQQARRQVVKSSDIHQLSKKLLDALLDFSLKELIALPPGEDDGDKLDLLILNRSRILMFTVIALFMMVSLTTILFSAGQTSAYYPPPT